jgi:hypothetical protein
VVVREFEVMLLDEGIATAGASGGPTHFWIGRWSQNSNSSERRRSLPALIACRAMLHPPSSTISGATMWRPRFTDPWTFE